MSIKASKYQNIKVSKYQRYQDLHDIQKYQNFTKLSGLVCYLFLYTLVSIHIDLARLVDAPIFATLFLV